MGTMQRSRVSSTPGGVRPLLQRQFSSLRTYNYRLYFFGQGVSLIGTWMQRTAQAWLVLKLTNSPMALGTTVTLQFLPIMLFTLFGGVLADRVDKLKLLKVTQSLALVQAALLGVLVSTGVVELWHVYVLALFLGTVNAMDGPVRQSFVVELVGKDQLVNAVALNSTTFNVARVLGPSIAGITIGTLGLSAAFWLNAASFVAVLAAYYSMRQSQLYRGDRRPLKGGVLGQVGEGLRYATRTPAIAMILILVGFIGTFGFNTIAIIPLVAEFILHTGPARFGLLTSCMGAGSLVSALALAAVGRSSIRAIWAGALAFVTIFAFIAVSQTYVVTAVLIAMWGMAGVAFSTNSNTTLQMLAPEEMRGRVISMYQLLFAGSTPIGSYLTGVLGEAVGVRDALLIEAALCLLGIGVAALYWMTHRQAFRREAPRPEASVVEAA